MSNNLTHQEHVTQPVVTNTKRTTFSRLQIIEALNTVYPNIKISQDAIVCGAGDSSAIKFEWSEC